MTGQMILAQNRLFGTDGLDVSDIKLFPGSERDVSSEQFVSELNKVLAQLEAGDYEFVEE